MKKNCINKEKKSAKKINLHQENNFNILCCARLQIQTNKNIDVMLLQYFSKPIINFTLFICSNNKFSLYNTKIL